MTEFSSEDRDLIACTEIRMQYVQETCFRCKGSGVVGKRWTEVGKRWTEKASTRCFQCDGSGVILKQKGGGVLRKCDKDGVPLGFRNG